MILSDRDIREEIEAGRVVIDPLMPDAIQPSSVDVRVEGAFRVFANHKHPIIDPREPQPDLTELIKVPDGEAFILHPGEFVLGSTRERWPCPTTWSRAWRASRASAAWGCWCTPRPGLWTRASDGDLTLELSNVATLPIAIYPGMKIGQLAFFRLSSPAERPYGSDALHSKYKGQRGPTASRYFRNFGAED